MKVSSPTDAAEIEADSIADQVMRMPTGDPPASTHTQTSIQKHQAEPDGIHRKCDACDEDELDEPVMRKEANVAAGPPPETPPGPGDKPPSINSVVRSGGAPLDYGTRGFFEPRFGIDLGHVRIHTGGDAALSARSIGARAYTLGSDIVFANGEYLPASESGRHLLAHEIAHVAQQPNAVAINRSALIPSPVQSVEAGTIHRAPDPLDDLFESPSQDGGTQEAGGGAKTKEPGCPKVPTRRGDDVPDPSCPKATHIGTNEVARINFCLDSDEPISRGDLTQIAGIVSSNHPKTRFLIHGYASPEGKVNYNFNLACHRANRIAEEMHAPIRAQVRARMPDAGQDRVNLEAGTEIQSRIETAAQGPTSNFGSPEANRLVIVYAQKPRTTPDEEPLCEDVHGKIGNIRPELAPDLPSQDLDGSEADDHLGHFRFCKDSDVFKGMKPADVRTFAHGQASKASFIVHGFSSPEGDAEYNRTLAHHRALRVARELINAGVRPEQVREVSAIGETEKFGDDDANRVAVVFAEGGKVDELEDGNRESGTERQRRAIIDEARRRLIDGRYNLAADAYVSFWTCGRTQTIRQAVERLTVNARQTDKNETLPELFNGKEEGIGANTVIVPNVALRADNPIECTMGRIIDMAFHHSEIGYPDLGGNFTSRHQAGLHLIHLAGLGQCEGKAPNPEKQLGDQKGEVDKPVIDDPRKKRRSPSCARTLEPTRLHFPTEGSKDRNVPEFTSEGSGPATYTPLRGKLGSNFDPEGENKGAQNRTLVTHPESDILTASATVKLKGDPATFADYEVGFIQSVISDETQADYGSGHSVIQELPVPTRLAALKGDVPVPEPWTTLDSMTVPKADGSVDISTFGIRLNTETAIGLKMFNRDLPNVSLNRFEHASRIAIWLVARRRGAPLDRFSIHFIDGVTYDLTQLCHIEHRHVKGIMSEGGSLRQTIDPGVLGGEGEITAFAGSFLANNKSELPADPSLMRFRNPVTSDINLFNQLKKIVEPPPATDRDMGKPEITAIVTDILDNLEVFDSKEAAAKKTGGKTMRRLGFDFIPLTITLPFLRTTGRLKTPENELDIPTKISGPGLGFFAAHHLQKALDFRLRSRDFGEDVIARPSILGGSDPLIGTVTITLPPIARQASDPPEQESDLLKRLDVIRDMAEAWACTELTMSEPFEGREFGRSYSMDRDKGFHPIPNDRLKMGEAEAPDGSFTTNLPCAADPDGVNLGGFHTHPVPDPIPPEPSDPDDVDYYTKKCPAPQHFIVTDNRVFRVSRDGKSTTEVRTLPKAPGCQKINLEGREKRKKIDDF